MTEKSGRALEQPIVGRGAAYLDYDNDGDLDVLLMDNRGIARLLRNDNGNQNDLLRLKLMGTKSNRDAIGARVTLTTSNGEHRFAMVKTGSSYLSQSELPLTFGLGKPSARKKTVSLNIVWPSGRKEVLSSIEANQFATIQESKGIISTRPITFARVGP